MIDEYSKARKEMREWLMDEFSHHCGYGAVSDFSSTGEILHLKFKSKFPSDWIVDSINELNKISNYWSRKSFYQSDQVNSENKLKTYTSNTTIIKNNFLAIDFETANRNRNSACAVGLVRVINNNITHFESYLIKPPTRHFEFTYLHGISYNDVKNSPTFKELWGDISYHFNGIEFIVAHNASFDKGVLEQCCSYYDIVPPSLTFNCTMKLSRQLWNIRPTKLSDVSRHFRIPLDHHQAASDTLACAKIMLLALNAKNESFRVNSVYVPTLKTNKQKIITSHLKNPVIKPIETNKPVQISSKPENNYIYSQVDNNAFKIPLTQETNINQITHPSSYDNLKVFIRIIFWIVFIYALVQLFSCQNRKNVRTDGSLLNYQMKDENNIIKYNCNQKCSSMNTDFENKYDVGKLG